MSTVEARRGPPSSVWIRRALAAGLALGSLVSVAAADVLIVGGGPYSTLQQAVDAAADGDLILVRSTSPGPAIIDGKGLVVVADAGTKPLIIGALVIRDLQPDQDVLVAGISATHATGIPLQLWNNQGSVRFLGGTFTGGDGQDAAYHHPDGHSAAYLTSNADVAFSRTLFVGGEGYSVNNWHYEDIGHGAPAAFVRNSKVAFHHCELTGGDGGTCWDVHEMDGGNGGSGIESPDAFLFVAGSVLEGGDGGRGGDAGGFNLAGDGGDGGHGVWLTTALAEAQLLDNTYLPGKAGIGGVGGGGSNGLPGQPIRADAGATANQIPGLARSLEIAWPQHEQSQATLVLAGQPQDLVYLLISDGADFKFSPPFHGTVLTAKPLIRRLVLGTLDATGTLQFPLNLPPLAAGIEHHTWYVQGAFVDPLGQVTLADGCALIVLDSAF